MKKIIYEKISMPKVKYIKCDFCKKKYDPKIEIFETQEMINIRHNCGYDSIFGDGKFIELDICQHCFKKIMLTNLENKIC